MHWIKWEDEQLIGFTCDQASEPSIDVLSLGPTQECVTCGKTLKLIWDVRIEEVEE